MANQHSAWMGLVPRDTLPLLSSTVVHTSLILVLSLCGHSESVSNRPSLAVASAFENEDPDQMMLPVRFGEPLQELAEPDGPMGSGPSLLSLGDNDSNDLSLRTMLASFRSNNEARIPDIDDRFGKTPPLHVHEVYASPENTISENSTIRFGSKRMPGSRHVGFASSRPLEVIVPDLDRYGSSVLNQASNLSLTGGAMMVSTAKPHLSLANVPLRFEYNPSNVDGNRLTVIAGEQPSILSLYDWELQPLARFVDSGHHGAVHIQMYGKHEKVSLDAAFEQTLLGLRFIQADLMPRGVILSQEYLPQDDRGYLLGPGELARLSSDQEVRQSVRELDPLMAKTRNGAPYSVLTDAKVQFEFEIVGNELILSGSPYFFFWEPANKGDQVIPKKWLNDQLKKAWPTIKKANPLVIESMERSFRTVAFFRFQKQKSPANWQRFVQQLSNISLERIPTPSLLAAE